MTNCHTLHLLCTLNIQRNKWQFPTLQELVIHGKCRHVQNSSPCDGLGVIIRIFIGLQVFHWHRKQSQKPLLKQKRHFISWSLAASQPYLFPLPAETQPHTVLVNFWALNQASFWSTLHLMVYTFFSSENIRSFKIKIFELSFFPKSHIL